MQSIFKSFKLQIYGVLEAGLKERAKTHLWHLLDSSKHRYSLQTVNVNGAQKLLGVQAEACCALVSGLGILYPDPMDRNTLLCLLMTRCKNENSHIFSHLRDLVLMDLVEQLQTFAPGSAEELLLRPGDDLLCHLLQSAVEESCSLLRDCVTSFTTNTSREEFNKKLVSIPVSPTIQVPVTG